MPDTPHNARFLTKQEREKAIARVEENMTGIKNNKWKKEQAIEAICDPNAWFVVLIYFASNLPNNGLITVRTYRVGNRES